jgi:hypothetical protein
METIRSSGRLRIHCSFRTAFFASLLAYTAFSTARITGAAPSIVISQVYGGGGNSGATFKNDFIES